MITDKLLLLKSTKYFYLATRGWFEASLLDRIKMTKNRSEFDRKNWQRWTLMLWNLTKTSQRWTFTGEYNQNIDEFDWKYINNPIFGHIHPLMFVVVVIFIIFSVMFTDFGHIHFGHLDSVKWITLDLGLQFTS